MCIIVPPPSLSFFKQNARAAAEMTPAAAAEDASDAPLSPATVSVAQLLLRASRLARHLPASSWYCACDRSLKTLFLDAREPLATGLLFGSSSQRFRKRDASPRPVCSARHGDRLRDLRISTRVGTADRNILTRRERPSRPGTEN